MDREDDADNILKAKPLAVDSKDNCDNKDRMGSDPKYSNLASEVSKASASMDDQAKALLDALLDRKQSISERAIENLTRTLAQDNCFRYERLHDIVIRHEERIRARLKKMTLGERGEMFTSGWANMTKDRHAVSLQDNVLVRYIGSVGAPSDKAALPYINEEDMKDRKKLLLFINSRGRHPPHLFAMSEQRFMTTGRIVDEEGALVKVYLCHEQYYGTTRYFETKPEAENFELHGYGKSIGASLQILHAQNRILKFLTHCCEKILHELDSKSLTSAQYPTKAEPPALLGDQDLTASFLHVIAMQPFLAPGFVDFGRLRHLTSMTARSSEEHVWLSREHPGYFVETYKNIINTDTTFLEDLNGTLTPDPLADAAVSRTLDYLIARSLYMLIVWEQLAIRLRELEEMTALVPMGSSMPLITHKHFETVLMVQYLLNQAKVILLDELQSFQADPNLEMCYARETDISNPRKSEIVKTTDIEQDPVRTQVCLLSENLAFDKHSQWKTTEGVHFALDLLETYLERNKGAREHISPSIDEVLFKLSVIAEIDHRLALQHWYGQANYVLAHMSEQEQSALLARVCSPFKAWSNIAQAKIDDKNSSKLVTNLRLGKVTDGKFHYPSGSRNKKKTIDTLCKAEENLDIFWRHVDTRLRVLSNNEEQETLQRLLDRAGTMKRTVPWEERKRAVAASKDVDEGQDVSQAKPLSELFHDKTKEITGNFNKSSISTSTKDKTRGTPAAMAEDDQGQDEPAEEAEREYIINKKTYKVMRALFSMPEDTEQPSKLRWSELKGAMVALGFSAHQTQGSVWRFDPSPSLALEHAINFHAPHPGDEVSHEVARRIGRRLNRAYGWEGAMFRVKG